MAEHENPGYDGAPEYPRERKSVQNDRNFEPLLDTGEAARFLRNAP
jgi:hypothetical protein